jgi:protein-disulfide isomerase
MNATVNPLLVPDPATDHILGPADARVTLVEYGDFECPSCAQAFPAVKIVLDQFGRQVRFVFRHFPLREVHPHAELAAEAAEAAGAQGRFWPYHDLLFTHQHRLGEAHLRDHAQQAGLDMARFENEMRDHVYLQRVQEQMQVADQLRVRATPSFYLNGAFVDVSFGLTHLQQAIERALARG